MCKCFYVGPSKHVGWLHELTASLQFPTCKELCQMFFLEERALQGGYVECFLP